MHHDFNPTQYFRTIGTHPVALTVANGDSVTIACVDAHGIDGNDIEITPRGKPNRVVPLPSRWWQSATY
jgi:hypothetical protein